MRKHPLPSLLSKRRLGVPSCHPMGCLFLCHQSPPKANSGCPDAGHLQGGPIRSQPPRAGGGTRGCRAITTLSCTTPHCHSQCHRQEERTRGRGADFGARRGIPRRSAARPTDASPHHVWDSPWPRQQTPRVQRQLRLSGDGDKPSCWLGPGAVIPALLLHSPGGSGGLEWPEHPSTRWAPDHRSTRARSYGQAAPDPKALPSITPNLKPQHAPKNQQQGSETAAGSCAQPATFEQPHQRANRPVLRVPRATSAPERTSGVSGYFLPVSEPLSDIFEPFLSIQAHIRSPETAGTLERTGPCPTYHALGRTDRQTDRLTASGVSPLGKFSIRK